MNSSTANAARKSELRAKKVELERQLAEIAAEEEKEKEIARERRGLVLLKMIDPLLELFAEHRDARCTDDMPVRHMGCNRCVLLDIKKNADWQGWPDNLDMKLELIENVGEGEWR